MSDHIDRLTLEAYADKLLPAAQRNVVETHVAECSDCQMRLASSQQMSAWLSRIPRERPAPNLSTRINAAIAAQRAPMAARWVRVLVTAAFAAGLALLALAAPGWSSWAQAATTVQLPTEQTLLAWLGSLVADPTLMLDELMLFAEQTLTGATEEMDVLLTLATILLALASVGGLAQLLGGDRPKGAPMSTPA
jgi:anti-sigma factor RsiW